MKPKRNPGRREFVRRMYERNRLRTIAGAALMIFVSALNVAIAYFLQTVLDVAAGGNLGELKRSVLVILGYIAFAGVVEFACFRVRNRCVEVSMRQYKDCAFERIVRKNIRSFTDESAGRYISALTNDAQSVQDNYVRGVFEIAQCAANFLFGIGLMLAYSWSLTLIAIGFTMLPMLLAMALGGRLARSERELSEKNEGFVATVKDLLSGFSVIKSFKAEPETTELFNAENEGVERVRRRRGNMADFISFVPGTLGGVASFGIFAFGALWTIRGWISIGTVVAFVQLMNYLVQPVQLLPRLLASRKAAAGLIDKLAEEVEQNAQSQGARKIRSIGQGIRLEHVGFRYEGSEAPALQDINLNFEAGKSYAIVGGSGSGKTTLLNLLLGSWDGYEGKILLDDAELRSVSTESLYDIISVIQQNVFIFDSTVGRNICMFKDFPEKDVRSAIRRAGVDAFVEEKGEEYRCGENGSALSGGEKQRISIARALLRNAPVLMMDEATSALDAQTAWEVTDAILHTEDLTRIVVTHRLEESLLKRYDEIVVLRGGRVVEQGTFDALMADKGYFYSLYNVAA